MGLFNIFQKKLNENEFRCTKCKRVLNKKYLHTDQICADCFSETCVSAHCENKGTILENMLVKEAFVCPRCKKKILEKDVKYFSGLKYCEDCFLYAGICGENAFWEFTKDNILHIYGSGTVTWFMNPADDSRTNYTDPYFLGPYSSKPTFIDLGIYKNAQTVVIDDGIESIADVFCFFKALEKIIIPPSVTYIHKCAFPKNTDSITVCGAADSYAQSFAEENGMVFDLESYNNIFGQKMSEKDLTKRITGYDFKKNLTVIAENREVSGYGMGQLRELTILYRSLDIGLFFIQQRDSNAGTFYRYLLLPKGHPEDFDYYTEHENDFSDWITGWYTNEIMHDMTK